MINETDMTDAKDCGPGAGDGERLLTRAEASAYARALGISLAVSTLAKRASQGDGPIITYVGAKPYYRVRHLLEWLAARTNCRRSTKRPARDDPAGDER